ncbi:Adenylate cyclase (EC [Olavius sp. associated proteobacterium Delta 1]|nr:Adenylate cyclase (EC [Olavius sp. associated proteobacterium Delta 1]
MTQNGYKRKLTAILSADVKEYSRLMREDEEETIRTLTTYRGTMTTLVQRYRGRVVDTPGDNLLAEFASVVDAVNSAVEIQRELAERNADLPAQRRMEFRIGVNLGDVAEEDDRIYGDGVNIAARVESICEGGGVCISGSAYEQVVHKLELEYEDLAEHEVKNLSTPVKVYRILSYPGAAAHQVIRAKKDTGRTWRNRVLAIAVILLVGSAVGIWQFYMRRPSIEPASVKEMAYPLPDKSSIAVLPFANMSEDPNQEYFCDGITEDLITDLSKISDLFVIARNSTFVYKGKPVKIKQVAEELGVRYVLEGSVRKAANQVRITAQLIDATTGHHLWAERYTGIMNDVFAYQDKITQKIVDALAVKLNVDEKVQLAHKDTNNIAAYDLFLKGWQHYLRWTPEDFFKAIPFFEKAVQIDPSYGRAYAALAATYWHGSMYYQGLNKYGVSIEEGLILAREYLESAMTNPTSLAHYLASEINLHHYQWQEARLEAERAFALEPNNAISILQMGRALTMIGNPIKGLDFIQKAMRMDPHYPARALYLQGLAYFGMADFEKAIPLFERSNQLNPEMLETAMILTTTYTILDRDSDARRMVVQLHSNNTAFMWLPMHVVRYYPFKDPQIVDRLVSGLLKSGLPTSPPYTYYKILDENRLTGDQIRKLVFGRKVIGIEVGVGTGGLFERSLDGKANFRGFITGSDNGKSWIENDLLCDQWQERYNGHKICYPVFATPKVLPRIRMSTSILIPGGSLHFRCWINAGLAKLSP